MDLEPSLALVLEKERAKKRRRKAAAKKKVSLSKSKGMDMAGMMALSQWNLLLFPLLSLVDLISVKRVCRTFAGFKPLSQLIVLKQKAAFQGVSKPFWNTVRKRSNVSLKKFRTDQFYFFSLCSVVHENSSVFGMFPSRKELFDYFLARMNLLKSLLPMKTAEGRFVVGAICGFDHEVDNMAFYIQGPSGREMFHGLSLPFMKSIMHEYPEAFNKLYVRIWDVAIQYYKKIPFVEYHSPLPPPGNVIIIV